MGLDSVTLRQHRLAQSGDEQLKKHASESSDVSDG